jgi:hypothetical protein
MVWQRLESERGANVKGQAAWQAPPRIGAPLSWRGTVRN